MNDNISEKKREELERLFHESQHDTGIQKKILIPLGIFTLLGGIGCFITGIIEISTASTRGASFTFVAGSLFMGLLGCIAGPLIIHRFFRIKKEEKEIE